MDLLDLGPQHSIEKPLHTYGNYLIMETEQAIVLLDPQLQEPHQILAKNNLKQIQSQNKPEHTTHKRQRHTTNNINKKLANHNALLVKADKGKTTVIINKDEYQHKIQEFINGNNYQKLKKDPTNKYSTQLQKNMKQCNTIINKQLTPKNPQPSTPKAQIKLHKEGKQIRPVINSINAPTYRMAKHLAKTMNNYLPMDNRYNTHNSTTLAQDLTKLSVCCYVVLVLFLWFLVFPLLGC
jgi:hypothetical protein